MLLVREFPRVELALVDVALLSRHIRRGVPTRVTLLISVSTTVAGDAGAVGKLEADMRAHVERRYARYGIDAVTYDLQIIEHDPGA
jgi:hypothetical protein